jgi:hypothetical protein
MDGKRLQQEKWNSYITLDRPLFKIQCHISAKFARKMPTKNAPNAEPLAIAAENVKMRTGRNIRRPAANKVSIIILRGYH